MNNQESQSAPPIEDKRVNEPTKSQKSTLLAVHLKEYDNLKSEQLHRIAVRDNVIYLTIASLSALISVVGATNSGIPLLIIPWVSVLLGWIYLVNDQKISAIGLYIRHDLDHKVKKSINQQEDLFGWETAHRSDKDRLERKRNQLRIDLMAFCVPGYIALMFFWGGYLPKIWADTLGSLFLFFGPILMIIISILELIALGVLWGQIVKYVDMGEGKQDLYNV